MSNLRQYIANEDVTDPDTREKLNTLAEKIDAMSNQEAKTCVGALDMTSINGLDDVLRVAGSLKNYIYGLFCEENPRSLEDYKKVSTPTMEMGGGM